MLADHSEFRLGLLLSQFFPFRIVSNLSVGGVTRTLLIAAVETRYAAGDFLVPAAFIGLNVVESLILVYFRLLRRNLPLYVD